MIKPTLGIRTLRISTSIHGGRKMPCLQNYVLLFAGDRHSEHLQHHFSISGPGKLPQPLFAESDQAMRLA